MYPSVLHSLKKASILTVMAYFVALSGASQQTTPQQTVAKKYIPLVMVGSEGKAEAPYSRPLSLAYWIYVFLGPLAPLMMAKDRLESQGIYILEGHPRRWWHYFSSHNTITLTTIIPGQPLAQSTKKPSEETLLEQQELLTKLPDNLKELVYQVYGTELTGLKLCEKSTDHVSNAAYDYTKLIEKLSTSSPVTDQELEQIAQDTDALKDAILFVDEAFISIVENRQELKQLNLEPQIIRCKRGVVCVAGKQHTEEKQHSDQAMK